MFTLTDTTCIYTLVISTQSNLSFPEISSDTEFEKRIEWVEGERERVRDGRGCERG